MSIRVRLALWYSTISTIGLAAFALILWIGMEDALRIDLDSWLTRQSDGFERFIGDEILADTEEALIEETREFSSGLPEGGGLELFDADGKLLLARPPLTVMGSGFATPLQPTRIPHDEGGIRSIDGRLRVAGKEYRFVLWRSLDDTRKAMNRLALNLATLTPVFLLLSLAGGWWMSRRALRPVDELTEAACRISFHDLSGSLPLPPHRDEIRRLCEAWNEMLKRLDVSARRLTQFTANASHELRTPLAVMRTTAELALRHERSAENYQHALHAIARKSEEMSRMLEGLMELARSDDAQAKLPFASLDLNQLISEVGDEAQLLASQRNLELEVRLTSAPVFIEGNRSALRRLLLLLVDNAIKFTPPPGRIEIRTAVLGPNVLVGVRDTGMGIADQDLPHIFDRFYQADRSRSGGGSGLGLSIAQWIVQKHNGQIEVESTAGKGALFRVSLPLHPRN